MSDECGNCAFVNRSAACVKFLPRRFAPEQGAGPDTVIWHSMKKLKVK